MEMKEMKMWCYDIETLKEFTLLSFYNIETKQWYEFKINRWENDLYKFIKFVDSLDEQFDWLVGFNTLKFDAQVIEFIIREHVKWLDKSNLEISLIIWQKAQDIIDDTRNNLFPPYKEEYLSTNNIDLFSIHHFDNENKRVSLKWLEFMMDMEDIEEMPIHHAKLNLTKEECELIVKYCRNDIKATTKFYYISIGETDNELYKGKNKIQDRLDFIEEFHFPMKAINYSDVKMGDEINLKGYMELTGLDRKAVYELKRNRGATKHFTFGDAIPKYVKFKTKEFNDFYNRVKTVKVDLSSDKQEFPFIYNGTKYTIARGGIHSVDKKRIIRPTDNEYLTDADVGSQYPNAINKRKLFPSHLGVKWLVNYAATIISRLFDKKKSGDMSLSAEDRRKFKGLSETKKLALNGGGYGKTNETHSWQYDPRVTYFCTIGNQFEILMLIEMLEIKGIHCVSANTDGIVCLYSKDLRDTYMSICKEWEVIVGNSEQGMLEYEDYKVINQLSVSSYLAISLKGKVKKKKEFLTEYEINKNKSRRVVPLALEAYLKDGIPVEKFITEHKNIFDFCVGVKSSNNYHYELISPDGSKEVFHKIVRYIISKDGKKLMKIKNEDSEATGADVSQCVANDDTDDMRWHCTILNTINLETPIEDYNINYEYYIRKANRILNQIKGHKKNVIINPNQINLFE